LKPERWGSPLVQEKYREEKACDRRHTYHTIIIIIIIHFDYLIKTKRWPTIIGNENIFWSLHPSRRGEDSLNYFFDPHTA